MKEIHFILKHYFHRVKILYRYGYRLEQKENMTDPLKKIELFKVCLLATFVSEDKILFFIIFYNLNLTITFYKELGPSCIGLVRPYLFWCL